MEELTKHWNACVHVEKSGLGRAIAHRLHCDPCGPHGVWFGGKVVSPVNESPHDPWLFDKTETLQTAKGEFSQQIQIGRFVDFGRGLVMDGMSQLAEGIDKRYTGALVYPAALLAPSRQRWLIAGGGDGAAAREILRFPRVEHVKLIDISRTVISATQNLIPSFWDNCQSDPRLEIAPQDVFAYMAGTVDRFDVVICDLSDPEDEEYTPFGESTADHLYTMEGFALFRDCLGPDGVFVIQAQELSDIRSAGHRRVRAMLAKLFPHVYSYRVFIEFFGYWESFIIALRNQAPHTQLGLESIESDDYEVIRPPMATR